MHLITNQPRTGTPNTALLRSSPNRTAAARKEICCLLVARLAASRARPTASLGASRRAPHPLLSTCSSSRPTTRLGANAWTRLDVARPRTFSPRSSIACARPAERAERFAERVRVGTVFMNRCDYLDPYLPWTGRKNSGKGASLSSHGFKAVTRLKAIHLKHEA